MPRIQRNLTAVLQFELDDDEGERDSACCICAHAHCVRETCRHTATQMPCCSQGLCCGCLAKVCKRCKCADDCDAVVAFCPFCREVMAVGVLDIFLGSRGSCKECARQAMPEPVQPPPAPAMLPPGSPVTTPDTSQPTPSPEGPGGLVGASVLGTSSHAVLPAH